MKLSELREQVEDRREALQEAIEERGDWGRGTLEQESLVTLCEATEALLRALESQEEKAA